jgi:hypothetical protein
MSRNIILVFLFDTSFYVHFLLKLHETLLAYGHITFTCVLEPHSSKLLIYLHTEALLQYILSLSYLVRCALGSGI